MYGAIGWLYGGLDGVYGAIGWLYGGLDGGRVDWMAVRWIEQL